MKKKAVGKKMVKQTIKVGKKVIGPATKRASRFRGFKRA